MSGMVDPKSSNRVEQFPRISERLQPQELSFEWFIPNSRGIFKNKPRMVKVEVLDLSVAGALIAGPNHDDFRVGSRIAFVFEGQQGVVEIRHLREASSGDKCFYGVVFVKMADKLADRMLELLAEMKRSDREQLDEFWSRAR